MPPHSDVLERLKPTSWLILSNRYCVDSGPCRISENMARNITGSTVTGHRGTRHPQQQVEVVVSAAVGFSSGPSQSSAAGEPSSVSASESRLRILVVSGSFMSNRGRNTRTFQSLLLSLECRSSGGRLGLCAVSFTIPSRRVENASWLRLMCVEVGVTSPSATAELQAQEKQTAEAKLA